MGKLEEFDLSKTSKAKHKQVIQKYITLLEDDPSAFKRHPVIMKRGIGKDILEKYFIENWPLMKISRAYKISKNTIKSFIEDYLMRHYDDTVVEQVATMGMENHLGVVNTFFATALYVAREAAFNAIFLSKIREKVAEKLAETGVEKTIRDKELMRAWDSASHKLERYTKLANEHLKTYLQLLEQVLDRQRDIAFVKLVYDYINRLDPDAAQKLKEMLAQDEYAKAIFGSLSGEVILTEFKKRLEAETFFENIEAEAEHMAEIIDVAVEEEDNKEKEDDEEKDGE